MKPIFLCLIALLLLSTSPMRGQDAATEERLNQLSGKIEDLIAGLEAQKKRIAELARELDALRDQQGRPNSSYATQEDLKHLAEKLQEVDKNRQHDKDLILKEIGGLVKEVAKQPLGPPKKAAGNGAREGTRPPEKVVPAEKGYEYVIKSGDNYSVIAQAYREQGIKVTPEQIEKANPGISPNKLRVGQKVFIPAPL
jgi:LysM repeat protein